MADRDAKATCEPIDLSEEPEFEVGPLTVRPAERAVVMGDQRRLLQPRVMKVLIALAQTRPGVVSRDRLIDRCWDGRIVGDDSLNRCILALRHLAQDLTPAPFAIHTIPRIGHRLIEFPAAAGVIRTTGSAAAGSLEAPRQTRGIRRKHEVWAALLGVAAIATTAILLGPTWPGSSSGGTLPMTVLIQPADAGHESRALAEDLTTTLPHLTVTSPIQLASHPRRSVGRRDVIIELRGTASSEPYGATIALKNASGTGMLWSDKIHQPSAKIADLKQQVAAVSGQVLLCLGEALNSKPEPLKPRTLQLYLNGCAKLANLMGREAESVVPIFSEVVRDAPLFEPGWDKLLIAAANVAEHTGARHDRERLKMQLASARKVNPRSAAAHLVQVLLLPATAYQQRMRLADQAVEFNPSSALAYGTRAQALQMVGRMRDAVVDSRRATQLDPLSPAARDSYIFALAGAGLVDAARRELGESERLWPGASNVAAAQFAFHLRFGDPAKARGYLRSEPAADWMNAASYLDARSKPTAENINRAMRDAERLHRASPQTLHHLIQVYGEFNHEDRLLDLLLNGPEKRLDSLGLTFRPAVVDFWRDRRALLVAKRAGLLAYWLSTDQWPDFCASSDFPYDCRAEGRKIGNS